MQVPSVSKLESLAILGGVLILGYAAYKVYKTGGSAVAAVGEGVSAVVDKAKSVYVSVVPASVRAPALKDLPSSGNYPEPGPVRQAEYNADIQARIDSMNQAHSPDAMGNGW